MSFEQTMAVVNRYMVATDTLAAIGAQLSLSLEGQSGDPRVAAALADVTAAAGLPPIDDLTPQERGMVLRFVKLYVREAEIFLADPAGAGTWSFTDPVVLEGWGRGSSMIPGLIAKALPDLGPVRSFLDVGVGIGWLAVAAAGVWPDATVVGLDVWEPSLERAKENIAGAGLDGRITLRNQDVTALDDVDTYDCAWVPSFFLTTEVLASALTRVVAALRPGGTVVVGRFASVPDPLASATAALRTARSGGSLVTPEEACAMLSAAGYESVRAVERAWPIPLEFVVGSKPAAS